MNTTNTTPAQIAANKTVVARLYEEVFNQQNSQAIDRWIASDVLIHDPMMGEARGIDAYRQLAAFFLDAFPQQHTTLEAFVAEGDLVSVLHTHTATNTGSFMGLPPTGRTVVVRGIELFRIQDGKITEFWRQDDDAG